jgi:hypothetical protein
MEAPVVFVSLLPVYGTSIFPHHGNEQLVVFFCVIDRAVVIVVDVLP